MSAITQSAVTTQVADAAPDLSPESSAYGGVLLLAKAWAALGNEQLSCGIRWQGGGRSLLLFVLVALPVLVPNSVLALARFCAGKKDPLCRVLGWSAVITQRRLSRFVSSPRHDWLSVLRKMAKCLLSRPEMAVGEEGIIAVDSTTAEKAFGRHLPHIRPVYDATKKRLVDGYEVVTACVAGVQVLWPLGFLPHRQGDTAEERAKLRRRRRKAKPEELPSKLDLALQLVVLAKQAGVKAATVVGDNAFAAMWWLQEIASLKLQWLVSIRMDRRLRIGAQVRACHQWVNDQSLRLLEESETGTTIWGLLLPEAVLLERHCQCKGLPCRPAYFERRNRHGKVMHRWYLATSQLEWDLETIWCRWGWRWGIEVLHRQSKQQMGLAKFHVRTWEGIVALIACTSLRLSLLCFVKAWEPTCHSLSMEALVPTLREAACTVEQSDERRARAGLPPNLPAVALWHAPAEPFTAVYWPMELKAA